MTLVLVTCEDAVAAATLHARLRALPAELCAALGELARDRDVYTGMGKPL